MVVRTVAIDEVRAELARRGIPLETPSLANMRGRGWREKAGTVKRQRLTIGTALLALGTWRPDFPALIVITRVAPRRLDPHDNLPAALKPVVDEIAEWLGLDTDDDPRVRWAHRQVRGEPREEAVRIAFGHGSRIAAVLRQLEAIVEETSAATGPIELGEDYLTIPGGPHLCRCCRWCCHYDTCEGAALYRDCERNCVCEAQEWRGGA